MEITLEVIGKGFDRRCLGQSWRALHQQVAIGEQGNQQAFNQGFLTDDACGELSFQFSKTAL